MSRELERHRTVKEGAAFMRQHLDDPDPSDNGIRIETLAEGLALLAAEARLAGMDEGLAAEIVLKACGFHRESLDEARRVMAALGYNQIADVLRRLARTAPRRLMFEQRVQARTERANIG
ncbi:hypothetical protein [Bradyrhizobium sp. LVM 105]|uniref:hypothetical protein n=1 Tax=Bradyrhizobium sp. LVM 105 TaxID=2341115 RepID=UPI000F800AF1|nr:hypothetical protein [Bradyrhizobium sp. LVM 105]RTE92762.1 hypothetical protein D6B98_14870 [Bradyrhizobium sp. LVM 105]